MVTAEGLVPLRLSGVDDSMIPKFRVVLRKVEQKKSGHLHGTAFYIHDAFMRFLCQDM